MVGTTNDHVDTNTARQDILRQQLENVIDHELHELGFTNLCKQIAFQVVEKVQKIDNDHNEIKSIYGELGVRLANLLVEPDNDTTCPSPSASSSASPPQNYDKRGDNERDDKCVIVIDDDEDPKAPNEHKYESVSNKINPESHCSEICATSNSNVSPLNTIPSSTTVVSTSSTVHNNAVVQVVEQYNNNNKVTSNDRLPEKEISNSKSINVLSQENEVNKSNTLNVSPEESVHHLIDNDACNAPVPTGNKLDNLDSNIKNSEQSEPTNSVISQDITNAEHHPFDFNTDPDVLDKQGRSPLILKIKVSENNTTAEAPDKYTSTMISHSMARNVAIDNRNAIINRKAKKRTFKFIEGAIVYAKPCGSDIWFEAELLKEILSTTNKQTKFQVRFMGGQRLRQKILQKSMATKNAASIDHVRIGTRIVAGRPSDTVNTTISKKYKDISSGNNINVMFAGVVAELACEANRYRYLVFFDDGYAQYFNLSSLFLVIKPSFSVWNDVAVDCQEFIKEYLQEYPYRPLVCTSINNTMQTEWNGEWWKSKVVSVDASLVKMLFDVDKRSEWIYRGTTRLEPLFNYWDMQEKPAKKKKKIAKSKDEVYVDEKITHPQFGICKHSLKDPEGVQQRKEWNLPLVKFKRMSSEEGTSSKFSIERENDRIMAKKIRIESGLERLNQVQEKDVHSTISSQEAFGVVGALQMSPSTSIVPFTSHVSVSAKQTLYVDNKRSDKTENSKSLPLATVPLPFFPPILPMPDIPLAGKRCPHICNPSCIIDRKKLIDEHRHGIFNYLSIPFKLGWKRESSKKKTGCHRDIYYRTPCNRRLRNPAEITSYILLTRCTNVCIDMFCFQSNISCRNQPLKPKPPLAKIDDLSGGKETCPIVCVNEITDELPNPIVYISNRLKAEDVLINTDPGFLVCCDCVDNCQDKSKCGCAQLTVESSNAIDDIVNPNAGYQYRRLKETITTGIYECNQNCSCSRETCYNRVVQNGIQLRLQVFMTENRGWGLRCIDDIPKGTFICTYAGQVLNEQTANREGMDFGDEYLAELDHIEVVEKAKDDYESDVPELRHNITISSDDDSDSDISSSILSISTDTGGSDDDDTTKKSKVIDELSQEKGLAGTLADTDGDALPSTENDKLLWDEGKAPLKPCHVPIKRIPSAEWPTSTDSTSGDSVSEDLPPVSPKVDFDISLSVEDFPDKKHNVADKIENLSDVSAHCIGNNLSTFSGKAVAIKSTGNKAYAHKSTAAKGSGKSTNGQPGVPAIKADILSTRSLYDGDKQMYVIDAKCFGNVGRFMNHCCSPNLLVQNVMVDTHDLRFPWVAFFSQQNIQSYTELTWDYNYEIGSVPNKTLLCKCGAKNCKGRLL